MREAREWGMNIAKQGVLPGAWFGAMTKEQHGRKIQLNRLENVANLVYGVMLSLLSHRAKIQNSIVIKYCRFLGVLSIDSARIVYNMYKLLIQIPNWW